MARFGFVGGTYSSESVLADCQRCMNLYPESVESGMGKAAYVLYPTPGLTLFAKLPGRSVRGELAINGRFFAVAGTTLYELNSKGAIVGSYANLTDDGNPPSLAASASQLLVASGGNIYVLQLTAATLNGVNVPAGAFGQIHANVPAGTGPVGPISQVAYTDGYFMALLTGTARIQLSNLNDASTWNDLYVSQVSVFPENLVSMIVAFREPILFGGSHTQAYGDTGDMNNPYQPVQGGIMEQGCIAQFSVAKLDNSIFWLGGDERGSGIVWRANGYIPSRISTHAIEYALSTYSTITDAIGYAYEEKGHTYYVLYFPTANATWVYDCATQLWHERSRWNGNQYEAWHAQCHAYCFGKHLVGDWATGNVYVSSISIATDNGANIRRMRRAPHISSEQTWIYHNQMQIDLEMGVGPIPPLKVPSSYPGAFAMADVNGKVWALSALDNGQLQRIADPLLEPAPLYLNDTVTPNTSWLLGMNAAGQITQTPVAYDVTYPQALNLATVPSQLNGSLSVVNGVLTLAEPYPSARDPQIMLRWSDDGGKTWSDEHWQSAGQAGTYKTRACWRRLGRSRDRVYEMVLDDPILWRVVDAYLDADPGFKPAERLSKNLAKMA